MTKLKLLGAGALVLSSALAAPAMAQQAVTNPGQCSQYYPNANCQTKGPLAHNSPINGSYQRRTQRISNANNSWDNGNWNNSYNSNAAYNSNADRRDPTFWPANAAADVVGGAVYTADAAVNTAGAIATAPFRNDSYASYNNGWNNGYANNGGWYNQSYAQRNGFVCEPGTWFRGEDGRRHICQ